MKLLATLSLTTVLVSTSLANTVKLTPAIADLNDLDHYNPVSWGFSLSGLDLGPKMYISSAVIRISNIYNWNDTSNKLFIDLIDNPTNGLKFYSDEKAPDSTKVQSDYFTDGTYKLKDGQAVTKLTTFSDTTKGTYKWVDGKKVYGELFEYAFSKTQLSKLTDYLLTDAGFDVSYKTEKVAYEVETQELVKKGYWKKVNGKDVWVPPVFKTVKVTKYKNVSTPVYTPRATVGLGFDADCHYYNTGVEFVVTTSKVPEVSTTLGLFASALAAAAFLRRRQAQS